MGQRPCIKNKAEGILLKTLLLDDINERPLPVGLEKNQFHCGVVLAECLEIVLKGAFSIDGRLPLA